MTAICFAVLFSTTAFGQINLPASSPYTETLDGIGSALPSGYTVRTGATATSLGSAASYSNTMILWSDSSGAFKNLASADGLTSGATTTQQNSSTDRALGLRQSGSFGDPGAAFVLQIANTTGKTNLSLTFKFQTLSPQTRDTTFTVDYGIGASPTTFTPVTTVTSGAFGSQNVTANFGTALNNQTGPVYIRIVALDPSTGSGSRDTVAIDDISITYTVATGSAGTIGFNPATYTTTENTGAAMFTVSRTGGTSGAISANYATASGTATGGATCTAGVDYLTTSGMVSFADGDATNKTIMVTICDDATVETDENFTINLTGANVGSTATATVTITDNDQVACTNVLVNELSADQPGTDDHEYVEVRGVPANCTIPANTYFVTLEGDIGSTTGNATFVVDISNLMVQDNGILFISGTSGVFTAPINTTSINDSQLNSNGIQNGANTYFVITSAVPVTEGTDYDTNDDGTADFPMGSVILDSIGYKDASAGFVYGPEIVTVSGATPDAISRFNGNTANRGLSKEKDAPDAASSFYGGVLQGMTSAATQYDPANSSANLPPNAALTPGTANLAPTAGEVFVGGIVRSDRGFPLGNVTVMLVGGPLTAPRYTTTSGFGYFGFSDVSPGSSYIISVMKSGYFFSQSSEVLSLTNEVTNLEFVGKKFFVTQEKSQ